MTAEITQPELQFQLSQPYLPSRQKAPQ
jgi:hypothetical protein